MTATCSDPATTLPQSCLCHSPSFRRRPCRRPSSNSRGGLQGRKQCLWPPRTCATSRDTAPMTSNMSKTDSQNAELIAPQHSSTARSTPAASSNLFQVLAQTAVAQGLRQVLNTVDQLQQTGNKLTKGFSARPPGYPPGILSQCLADAHCNIAHCMLLQHLRLPTHD